ncbi:MAG: GTP-binding protein [Planctomycetes bacterium]|nr:GTP-binding protein [Planctomycetota bacterium]MCB9872431.1 GTP-binding protein [Planctomycetota bacterium]MCB9888689.1 GTP-binding protein [Planctomycetota bacterium]
MSTRKAIPLHLLTGFLGSGKTTLLSALLRRSRQRIAVIVNEIGEIALDHWLIESADEDVMTLASGCVCCSLRDDLRAALERVVAHRPARIVVETTGLADPAPILHGLVADRGISALVEPVGCVAAVDASRAEDLLATHAEARRQLELCDRIVLTKGDLAPHRVSAVLELLERAAPGCDVRAAEHGELDPDWLLAAAALPRLTDPCIAGEWLHHHGGGSSAMSATGVATHAFSVDHGADVGVLHLWLQLVTQLDGPRLLRIKGLVEDRATSVVHVLQAAGRSVSPPRPLAGLRAGVRGVRFVVVERGLGAVAVARLLGSLREAVEVRCDAPPASSATEGWR